MSKLTTTLLWPVLAGLLAAVVMLKLFPNGEPLPSKVKINQVKAPNSTAGAPSHGPVSYADAVGKAAPAVVNIYTRTLADEAAQAQSDDPIRRDYYQRESSPQRQRVLSSLGSGVIISDQGYIITNHHVVSQGDSIIVALRDGREAEAKLIGTDPETDLAVLKIGLSRLTALDLASSNSIEIGDVVLAIGNPYGVGQTVTMGIISATGRNQLGINTYENFIQTDAAINPGNSGGALINAHGHLIGINTAIFSRSGGYQGIGFAIPADLVKGVTKGIIEEGRVIRGWLGIEVQEMTQTLAESFGAEEAWGLIIAGVYRDSPAHIGGLQPGDVLISIDDLPIKSGHSAMNQIAATRPGKVLNMEVLRSGERVELHVAIGDRPPTQAN